MSSPREHEVAVLGHLVLYPELLLTVQAKLQDHKWRTDTGRTFGIIERLGADANLNAVSMESTRAGGIGATDLSSAMPECGKEAARDTIKAAMDALLDADREQSIRDAMQETLTAINQGMSIDVAKDRLFQTLTQIGGDSTVIFTEEGTESVQLAMAEAAVLKVDPPILYQRGGMIVRVIRTQSTSTKSVERDTGASVIVPCKAPYLQRVFGETASWRKKDSRRRDGDRYRKAPCPRIVVDQYMSSRGRWSLHNLNGVISAPTIRPDGTVFQTPGYDKATGLLAAFETGSFPDIKDKPSQDDAFEALGVLYGALDEFKFTDEHEDRAAAIAAVLTGLVRRSLPAAPLIAIRAPRPRSGKTMLADVISMIATGARCTTTTQAKDRAEEDKLILSILIAGDAVVNLDNVERPLGKTAIVPVLSGESFTGRLLKKNETATLRTNTLWIATGNGLTIIGDLVDRTLPINLDTQMERPEERRFSRDLYEWIPAHRPELVAAVLTIIRAYQAAGCPDTDAKPWAGFEEWGRMARYPLVWLGQPDPCATRTDLYDDDPETSILTELLEAWWNVYGTDGRQLNQVLADVNATSEASDPDKARLREALTAAAGNLTGRRVGDYLRRHKNRSEGGLRFVTKSTKPVATWSVKEPTTRSTRSDRSVSHSSSKMQQHYCALHGVNGKLI